MIAVERAQPGVVERVVVETAKSFAPRIVRPDPFLELFLDASIADSSNTATVKKNQNHGKRSRRQPHGKFASNSRESRRQIRKSCDALSVDGLSMMSARQ
jgi:hypothetical protein